MDLIAPFGFFGAGNIGDESTLQGFARLLSGYGNGTRVWVASRNPSHTAYVEPSFKYYKAHGLDPRRWLAQLRSPASVIVGGTPIMDVLGAWPLSELTPLVLAAHHQERPIVFIGVGVERLQREESRSIVAEVLAPAIRHWTVRSERDKSRLAEYGVAPESVTVAADLAWTLEAVALDFGKSYLTQLGLNGSHPFVGVNVNNERFVLEREPELFEKMAKFLDALVEQHDFQILFFCNEVREDQSFDKVASLKVLACMKYPDRAFLIPNKYWTPQQMLSLIGCCRATIGMRYHFCLFSVLQGVPFLALKRSDKVDDLCWDMNWPYGVTLKDLSVPMLLDMFSDIERNRRPVIEQLQQRLAVIRQRSLANSAALDVLSDCVVH